MTKSAVVTTPDTAGSMFITALAAERFVLCPWVLRALLPVYLNQILDSGTFSARSCGGGYGQLSKSCCPTPTPR
jgi:hypothetical protein